MITRRKRVEFLSGLSFIAMVLYGQIDGDNIRFIN